MAVPPAGGPSSASNWVTGTAHDLSASRTIPVPAEGHWVMAVTPSMQKSHGTGAVVDEGI